MVTGVQEEAHLAKKGRSSFPTASGHGDVRAGRTERRSGGSNMVPGSMEEVVDRAATEEGIMARRFAGEPLAGATAESCIQEHADQEAPTSRQKNRVRVTMTQDWEARH